MAEKTYQTVNENDLFIGGGGDLAMTSPLLECAGMFIYSQPSRKGTLIHWQDRGIGERAHATLQELKLRNPHAVIAGCGIPIECLDIDESQTYREIREFLDSEKIPIRDEKVGLDTQVELKVNFSDGSYEVNQV